MVEAFMLRRWLTAALVMFSLSCRNCGETCQACVEDCAPFAVERCMPFNDFSLRCDCDTTRRAEGS